MTLNRNSRLVTWAYLIPPFNGVPKRTTLCAFFWRAFVFAPVFWVGVSLATMFALYKFAVNWRVSVPASLAVVAIIIAVVVGGERMDRASAARREERWQRRQQGIKGPPSLTERITQSVFWQGLKAVKGKVCPLIELVE